MDSNDVTTEKLPQPVEPTSNEEETQAIRAVAFPDDSDIHEDRRVRPKGAEMKREMTQEDRDLAAAGYEHLEEKKAKEKAEFDSVDIQEHRLTFEGLERAHNTVFDTKDPAQSAGLTSEDAKARLARDGQNIITPPKKKSALRKVRFLVRCSSSSVVIYLRAGVHIDSISTVSIQCSTFS